MSQLHVNQYSPEAQNLLGCTAVGPDDGDSMHL
jgi:hypothetical protein